jgi:hypothetical protein
MKRLVFAILITAGLSSIADAKYSGGSGTAVAPYQIATADDLLALAVDTNNYDKHFVLTADIDLSSHTFTTAVIAPNTDNASDDVQGVAFSGVFDGAGHKISNLTIDTGGTEADYLGLFGYTSGGEIKNVRLENVTITSGDDSEELGGLVGENGGTISNCYSTGNVTGGDDSWALGGLVGYNYEGSSISNCYSTSNVTGGDNSSDLGGLAGYNDQDGSIINCFSTGIVAGGNNSSDLGGLAGENYYGEVNNSYSTGTVTGGANYLGGLVGYNDSGDISKCYSTGTVTGDANYLGGLVGRNDAGTVTACFWNITTSGRSASAGGTGLPTTDMMKQSTYTGVGWDFVGETVNGTADIWTINEGVSYPKLAWQSISAPGGVFATDGTYNDHIRVTWNSVSGATGYEVWRGTNNSSGSASNLGDRTSPFNDTGVTPGTTYYYWVKAAKNITTSDFSSSDSGNASTSCTVPSAPTGVSATDGTYTDKVRVSWVASSGATSYEIRRYTSNKSGSAPKVGDSGSSPYDDTSAVAGTTYWYWVKAVNSGGTSGFSDGDSGYRATVVTPKIYSVSVTKCTVTAGSKDYSDKISISGTINAPASDISAASSIEVTISSNDMSPRVKTFPIDAKTFKKGKFKCSASNASFSLATKTTKFSFSAKNIDLSGLGCPVTLQVKIGDSIGTTQVGENIVNGAKKPIPINLMMGVKDVLRVDKCQVKHGKKKPSTDQLSVKGAFTVKDTGVNMTAGNFVVTLGTQTFTLPAGSFKKKTNKFTCSKVKLYNGPDIIGIAAADFNFKTCVFTLTIKGTTITGSGTASFRVQFAGFSESVNVVLP